MSLAADKAKLTALTRDIVNQWDATRDYWRDAKALEFQRKYIEELTASVDKATGVLDELDKVIAKIRSDCE
jgi:hypothetical protein